MTPALTPGMYYPTSSALDWLQSHRRLVLALIICAHAAVFLALRSTPSTQPAQSAPKEIFASFIVRTPITQPDLPKPAEPPKKQVPPVAKKTVKPAPVKTPTPKAITAPPAPTPEPETEPVAEPVAAAAPSAPTVAATPTPAPAQPKTVSGVEYIQAPQPDYPPISKRMGEQGKVLLRILVNQRGRPERVDIQRSSGSARLDEAARQAAMRAVFKPHRENGQPVAVYALVPINFSLD